jgi:hypothetical protein
MFFLNSVYNINVSFLGESTVNSLLSICNKSSEKDKSYESKIKLLKSEKVLLEHENYTNMLVPINKDIDVTVMEVGESRTEKLSKFFDDGKFILTALFLPTPVLPNGYVITNGITTINSEYSYSTKKLLQKNIKILNNETDKDIVSFNSFNINGDSVFIGSRDGSTLVGEFAISGDFLEVQYIGYEEQHKENVKMLFKFQKVDLGYYITIYLVNDTGPQYTVSAMYSLKRV